WPQAVRTGVEAFTATLDAEPSVARLALVEAPGGGREALGQYRQAVAKLVGYLDRALPREAGGRDLGVSVGEMAVGSALGLLGRALHEESGPSFAALNPQLYFALLMPYVGPAEADALVLEAYSASL